MQVRKRDGIIVEFNLKKIEDAICKAMVSCNKEEPEFYSEIETEKVLYNIAERYEESDIINVETIQDIVEEVLMKDFSEVAKAYILYRNERSRIRENKSELMQLVEEKLFATNVQNQNAKNVCQKWLVIIILII